eukprot:6142694-Amphidinium_carterae.1
MHDLPSESRGIPKPRQQYKIVTSCQPSLQQPREQQQNANIKSDRMSSRALESTASKNSNNINNSNNKQS